MENFSTEIMLVGLSKKESVPWRLHYHAQWTDFQILHHMHGSVFTLGSPSNAIKYYAFLWNNIHLKCARKLLFPSVAYCLFKPMCLASTVWMTLITSWRACLHLPSLRPQPFFVIFNFIVKSKCTCMCWIAHWRSALPPPCVWIAKNSIQCMASWRTF